MRRTRLLSLGLAMGWLLIAASDISFAADSSAQGPKFDTGDTAWMLTSSALVLMMTIPGLALFYGGLVRSKNILSTFMHSLFCAALISVTWVLFGYSLSFSGDGSLWGNLNVWGLGFPANRSILGTAHSLAPTVPALVFVIYQATFAIITPALISGTFAERMRFPAFALFMLLWSIFIYTPLCHWVWGGGWMGPGEGSGYLNALDFAGGTVVHISSGISALVTAIYLGKRFGYGHEPMPPHNLPFTVMGAALLWVGWFGFNAGSALGANELAATAFVNTNTAAAAAALGWLAAEWIKSGKPTILGAASGAVAGLVAITPGAGFVNPMSAIFIGLAGGVVCYTAVSLKPKLGYDDALDVVGVHMVGGTLGALLTGIFATKLINPAGADGGAGQLMRQGIAVLATFAFCGIGTYILLVIVNAITRVRADQQEEIVGMDLSQHSERAYMLSAGENLAFIHEPRPAMTPPPPLPGRRFAVKLAGIDTDVMTTRWRALCQNGTTPHPPEFKLIYSQVSTIRGDTFRFRGGDPKQIQRGLEQLFKPVAANVTAEVVALN